MFHNSRKTHSRNEDVKSGATLLPLGRTRTIPITRKHCKEKGKNYSNQTAKEKRERERKREKERERERERERE